MSSDDYQVQNVYRYARKSYKKSFRRTAETEDDGNVESENPSPRSDGVVMDLPSCSCELDPDEDVANILHKKCPVVTLARQQLQRLLDDTDKILCDNTRCCRSIYDFLCLCQEALQSQNKCYYALVFLIGVAFFVGLLFGAASCGSYLGKFNSPILSCIDNFFIPDAQVGAVDYRGII